MGIVVICLIISLAAWGVAIFLWMSGRTKQAMAERHRLKSGEPAGDITARHEAARHREVADELEDRAASEMTIAKVAVSAGVIIPLAILAVSSFTVVGTSKVGVVTTFGKPHTEVLGEGPHFVMPISRVHEIFTGLDTVNAEKMSAASKDMQAVSASATVNYAVEPAKARDLYILNPTLLYRESFVAPALFETFKAVTSRYTAEELITKRALVSTEFIDALKIKLAQFNVRVQNVNITDFGFSKAFDEAIEAKVTATQRAETAKNDLERVKFEAQQAIERAKAGAETIRIQAEAISKQGGEDYVSLKAIEKWDGKMPQYMMGQSMPLINLNPAGK